MRSEKWEVGSGKREMGVSHDKSAVEGGSEKLATGSEMGSCPGFGDTDVVAVSCGFSSCWARASNSVGDRRPSASDPRRLSSKCREVSGRRLSLVGPVSSATAGTAPLRGSQLCQVCNPDLVRDHRQIPLNHIRIRLPFGIAPCATVNSAAVNARTLTSRIGMRRAFGSTWFVLQYQPGMDPRRTVGTAGFPADLDDPPPQLASSSARAEGFRTRHA